MSTQDPVEWPDGLLDLPPPSLKPAAGGQGRVAAMGANLRGPEGDYPTDVAAIPEASFAALFEQSPAAAVMLRRGIVLAANQKAMPLFGLTDRSELVGQRLLNWIAPRARAAFDHLAVGRPMDDMDPRAHDTVGMRSDQSEFPMEALFGTIAFPDRQVVLVYLADLTERQERETRRKQLEEQARQSAKMEAIGQLAGGIAHDFNNLMTVVLGYTDLLIAEDGLPADKELDLMAIGDAARRATVLTRQLLTFSRQQMFQPRVVLVDVVVAPIVPMLRRLLGEDIDLRYLPNDVEGAVLADPGQIEQIVMNLAINARDAMPAGGLLTLETSEVRLEEPYVGAHDVVQPGQYVVLAVSDTGIGMDDATCARIFEPFFTTKPNGQGTGLGLSTVYGIVKQAGGHVWAYSELGHGSVFKVYLPRVRSTFEPVAAPPPRIADLVLQEGQARTILIVEDEAAVRGLMKTVLLRLGYRVLDSGTPLEAIRIAETGYPQIDLLLTDVIMPGMTGPELARRIVAARPGLPFLFSSGYTERAARAEDLIGEGVSFLAKPFTAYELGHAVSEALQATARN